MRWQRHAELTNRFWISYPYKLMFHARDESNLKLSLTHQDRLPCNWTVMMEVHTRTNTHTRARAHKYAHAQRYTRHTQMHARTRSPPTHIRTQCVSHTMHFCVHALSFMLLRSLLPLSLSPPIILRLTPLTSPPFPSSPHLLMSPTPHLNVTYVVMCD